MTLSNRLDERTFIWILIFDFYLGSDVRCLKIRRHLVPDVLFFGGTEHFRRFQNGTLNQINPVTHGPFRVAVKRIPGQPFHADDERVDVPEYYLLHALRFPADNYGFLRVQVDHFPIVR